MRGAIRREMMALDGTGKTFTDRHAGDIDLLADRKRVDSNGGTPFEFARLLRVESKLFQR